MANGASSVRWTTVGIQTGLEDTPVSLDFIDVQSDAIPDCVQQKIPIKLQTSDGELTASQLGVTSATHSFDMLVRGGGYDSASGETSEGAEVDMILDCAMGAGTHGVGSTAAASGHDASTILIASTTNIIGRSAGALPRAVMIDCGAGSSSAYDHWYCAREPNVVTANTSFTVDRALDYSPGDAAHVIYSSTTWSPDADDVIHDHLFCSVEGPDWRRDLFGCAVTAKLVCPAGELAKWQVNLAANSWQDVADAGQTYVATVSGRGLVVTGSPFYIGATKTELIECELDLGYTVQPKRATSGVNGHEGWIYLYEGAKFKGRIFHNDTTMATFNSASTVDVAFQLGDQRSTSTPGSALYVVIPALCVTSSKITTFNGVDAMDFEGFASRPTTAQGAGSLRVHLFGRES